ncbi:hypothetical protein F5884DRAFT_848192 [Xylogone sp. PMI_703]|nr:hypothetical protein F5884DRAFT_848192 [Xylogone sp. PMI_703]
MAAIDRAGQISKHLSRVINPEPLLGDHVIAITGAGQGMILSIFIFISDIDKDKAEETAAEIRYLGSDSVSVIGDVMDGSFPERFINAGLQKFGKINCIVNNAGFCLDHAIHKMDDKEFETIMKIHNVVPFRLVRALSSRWLDPANNDMPKSIINVSSTSGLHGSMGRMGVVGMTKTIASEWGRPPEEDNTFVIDGQKITPGIPFGAKKWSDLSTSPLGRVGKTTEAAGPIFSSYVTGRVIECSGRRFM